MPRNGAGVYARAVSAYVYNTVIDQAAVNSEMTDIASALTASIAKDGQTTPTANLPMGTYRHTGVGNASARTDYAAAGQVQDGLLSWVDGGGTADAITATYAPAITALVNGQLCFVRATAANATATPTFSPSGLTARTIVKEGGNALVAGSIRGDGHELILRYDLANTRWELLNPRIVPGVEVQAYDAELAAIAGLTSAANKVPRFTGSGAADLLDFKDEDNMASDSATAVPSQQSVKAYVDTSISAIPTTGWLTAGTVLTKNPIAFNSTTTQAHGLSARPKLFNIALECLTAEQGYSVGDIINYGDGTGGGGNYGIGVLSNTTNTTLLISGALAIMHKTSYTGVALTAANWKIIITPYSIS